MKLILASTSPRRREIVTLLGVPFEVIAPEFDEIISECRPAATEVLDFAIGKARSVARNYPDAIVIGSDTMILVKNQKIGKPETTVEARQMLRALSGKTHIIFTSVAIVDGIGGPGFSTVEQVFVRMRAYSDAEIERYIACGESLDKAGGYSIQGQGASLIESITGDYLAAVGLPLRPIAEYLKSRSIAFPLDVDRLYADKAFMNWRSF